jgi:hypothetical protein
MNSIWTKEKSRLSIETLRAMLIVRLNCDMECAKFYGMILKDHNLLRKVSSSEKYTWYNHDDDQVQPSTSIA